jgi:catalase
MQNDTSGHTGSGQDSTTGTGWIDQPDNAATLAILIDAIKAQQNAIATSSHTHLDGRVDRGQHQKQLFAAWGTLRIFDTLPPRLTTGPFAKPDPAGPPLAYRVACRFSNGQPCPFADSAPDVRGAALKFFTADGTETDLLMTNEGGRSHARNAVQFMNLADIIVAQLATGLVGGLAQGLKELLSGKLGPLETARMAGIVAEATLLHKVDSLTTERYWGSVVKLGDAAIKHSLQPDPATAAGTDADRDSHDYLREDLLNRLKKGPLKWKLAVALFVDEQATPVNDASVVWNSAPVTIGQLEISTAPSAADEACINQMAFNPANGFEPLGITHARKAVYAASAANRKDRPAHRRRGAPVHRTQLASAHAYYVVYRAACAALPRLTAFREW